MMATQGDSFKISNGYYVNQTIGQLSFTGVTTNNQHIIFQGFQQGVWNQYQVDVINTNEVSVYPNPCSRFLKFSFSNAIDGPVTIAIYDINGKLVYTAKKSIAEKLLVLDLPQLSDAMYMVELTATNIRYNSKIIKKE